MDGSAGVGVGVIVVTGGTVVTGGMVMVGVTTGGGGVTTTGGGGVKLFGQAANIQSGGTRDTEVPLLHEEVSVGQARV